MFWARKNSKRGIKAHGTEFETSLNELNALLKEEEVATGIALEEGAVISEIQTMFQEWVTYPDQLFALRDNQLEREPAYKVLATDGTQLAGQVLIDTQTLIELQSKLATEQPTAENIALLREMAEFQASFTSMFSGLRNYTTTLNRLYRSEYSANRSLNEIDWQVIEVKWEALTWEQQQLLGRISKNRDAFLELPDDEILPVLESDAWREDLRIFRDEATPLAEEMLVLLDSLNYEGNKHS